MKGIVCVMCLLVVASGCVKHTTEADSGPAAAVAAQKGDVQIAIFVRGWRSQDALQEIVNRWLAKNSSRIEVVAVKTAATNENHYITIVYKVK
jgi:ABC-type glycerol-3-phosphate transport system substrate-binding protein